MNSPAITIARADLRHIRAMPAVVGTAFTSFTMGQSSHDEEATDRVKVAGVPPLDCCRMAEDDFVVGRVIRWQPIMVRLRQRSRRSGHTENYAGGKRANHRALD